MGSFENGEPIFSILVFIDVHWFSIFPIIIETDQTAAHACSSLSLNITECCRVRLFRTIAKSKKCFKYGVLWCVYIYTHVLNIVQSKFEAQCCHKQNSFQKASKHDNRFSSANKADSSMVPQNDPGFDVCNGEVLCVRRESKYKMLFRPVQCHAIAAMVAMSRKWDPDVNFMNSHISCHEKSQEPLRFRPIYANFSHFTMISRDFTRKCPGKKTHFLCRLATAGPIGRRGFQGFTLPWLIWICENHRNTAAQT